MPMPIGFKTVFYKEFAGYFRSGNAYIILGVYALLSFAATFYVGGYFTLDNTSLASFFLYQPEILTVLMPAVTMRSWTDERRQGTVEYLLTQPVDHASAVLAKFAAAWLFGPLWLALGVIPAFALLGWRPAGSRAAQRGGAARRPLERS